MAKKNSDWDNLALAFLKICSKGIADNKGICELIQDTLTTEQAVFLRNFNYDVLEISRNDLKEYEEHKKRNIIYSDEDVHAITIMRAIKNHETVVKFFDKLICNKKVVPIEFIQKDVYKKGGVSV